MLNLLRPFAPWLAATLLSALLLLSNRNTQGQMLRAHVTGFLITIVTPFSAAGNIFQLWSENRELRELLASMTLELAEQSEGLKENSRLRRMMDFKERNIYSLIPAEVIGLTDDLELRGLLIDKGVEDSVKIDMAVITVDGIVGRVYRSHSGSAVVQLITDINMGAAARLISNREDGIIHTAGGGGLSMDIVPISAFVNVGDTVVTSGLDGVFPEGLPVGLVRSKRPNVNGWLWDIHVTPFAQLNKLEEVFIIKRDVNAP